MISNLFKYEEHFRLLLGLLISGYALLSQFWLILPIGLLLVYSANIRFCPIYHVFGINAEKRIFNDTLTQLPKHNPEPVFIFSQSGDLIFRNSSAEKILPSLTTLEGLESEHEKTQLSSMYKANLKVFVENEQSYMMHYKSIPKTSFIVAYGFNITELLDANEEIINTQKELLYHMGEIGETRSKETGNHVKRVAKYSYLLASLYGLDAEQRHLLKMASPMHDIGKVAIPDSILLKPGKLNAEEWVIMKTHASIGYDLLKKSDRPILKAAAIVAGEHHEKWDGSGYPNGASGDDIHIFGRITALADVYDALASDRVYKKAWPLDDVIQLIKDQRGIHFDPKLVDLFMDNLSEFNKIRLTYLD